MLNIPDSVKTLFQRDGVRKNFRVHFPNGELSDITNDNIVQESVKFTESLCSQDVLKFGLTEASVIEFETVGIGNMYGMTIECGIEIDLSSLTAAQLNDIASGTWDGVYTGLASSDIGYAYFRVPYGIFRIESCPRDHHAMAHRKVQAFSASPTSLQMSQFESNKLKMYTAEESYTPDLYKLFLSQFGHNNPQILYDEGFTDGSIISKEYPAVLGAPRTIESPEITVICNGIQHTVKGVVSYYRGFTSKKASQSVVKYFVDDSKLYAIEYNGYSPDAIFTNAVDAIQTDQILSGIDLEASGYASMKEFANDLFTSKERSYYYPDLKMLYPQAVYTVKISDTMVSFRIFSITEADKAIYPKLSNAMSEDVPNAGCSFMIPYKFEILRDTANTVYTETLSTTIDVRQYNELAGYSSLQAQFEPTLESGIYRSFVNSYSLNEIMNGFNEIVAMFGKVNRKGRLESFRLSKANPVSVIPNEYADFWWDEYDVLPIGAVSYTYTASEGNENTTYYYFGPGGSIYDMTGNAALKAISEQSVETIELLLDAYFIPNLDPIAFTPIDLTMKGLPYLEPGDYLAVTAEDGTIAYSFNMRQTISGIQVLTAEIESTSGDIIESGEGET